MKERNIKWSDFTIDQRKTLIINHITNVFDVLKNMPSSLVKDMCTVFPRQYDTQYKTHSFMLTLFMKPSKGFYNNHEGYEYVRVMFNIDGEKCIPLIYRTSYAKGYNQPTSYEEVIEIVTSLTKSSLHNAYKWWKKLDNLFLSTNEIYNQFYINVKLLSIYKVNSPIAFCKPILNGTFNDIKSNIGKITKIQYIGKDLQPVLCVNHRYLFIMKSESEFYRISSFSVSKTQYTVHIPSKTEIDAVIAKEIKKITQKVKKNYS